MNSKEHTAKLRELRLAKEKRERETFKAVKAARASLKEARVNMILAAVSESLRAGSFHENDLGAVLSAVKSA